MMIMTKKEKKCDGIKTVSVSTPSLFSSSRQSNPRGFPQKIAKIPQTLLFLEHNLPYFYNSLIYTMLEHLN